MPIIIKTIERLLQNRKNVSFEDLEKILLYFGYKKGRPRSGSSHNVYRKDGERSITVPYKRPHVKEVYVSNVIGLLGLEEWYEEHKNH